MVLYFSGTGNSRHVAERIAQKNGDELVSINLLIKQGGQNTLVSEKKPFVFACPAYAWRIPRIMEQWIRETVFQGRSTVYFIMTCGDETANAIHYVKKLCKYKKWRLQGFGEVIMPENYVVRYPAPDLDESKELVRKADRVIDRFAIDILAEKQFSVYTSRGFKGKIWSKHYNGLFYSRLAGAKGFYSTDQCIGCGKCVTLCPLNNITMEASRPVWANDCTHCMACINHCPVTAIEYADKTQGQFRYLYEKMIES